MNEKLKSHNQLAIFSISYGPTFGSGHDLYVCDKSNVTFGSYSNFCITYNCPQNLSFSSNSKAYLTGKPYNWLTLEIEVFQIVFDQEDYALNESVILNSNETDVLYSFMGGIKNTTLLYRASRDSFRGNVFHAKCDGKSRTLTIIQTNNNYVFGGYTDVEWEMSGAYKSDSNAYLFSLRRNGSESGENFKIKNSQYATYSPVIYGPTFGAGHDMYICNRSDIKAGSYTNLGYSYTCPAGLSDCRSYLASGSYNTWLTSEIEVYEIF